MSMAGFNVFGPVYIDGVPVKVSERFRPPPKITLPPNFEIGNPTEVLFLDYDFSLEERVVAWTDEREMRIKEEKERSAQEAAEAEARALAEETAVTNSSATENKSDNNGTDTSQNEEGLNLSETNSPSQTGSANSITVNMKESVVEYSNQTDVSSVLKSQEALSRPYVVSNQPVFCGASVGILQPLPAVKPDESSSKHIRHSSFDPKDFENELDPFDRIELKTLDDMKELDMVLQNVHISKETKDPTNGNTNITGQSNITLPTEKTCQVANSSTPSAVLEQGAKPNHISSSSGVGYSGHNLSGAVVSTAVIGVNSQSTSVSYKQSHHSSDLSQQGHPAAAANNTYIHPHPSGAITSSVQPNSVSYSNNNNVNGTNFGSFVNGRTGIANMAPSSISQYSNVSSGNNLPVNQTVSSTGPEKSIQPHNNMNQYEVWREFLQKSTSSNISNDHHLYDSIVLSTSSSSHIPNGYVNQTSGVPSTSGSKSQANSRSNTPTPPTRLRSARSTPDLAALNTSAHSEKTPDINSPPPVLQRKTAPPPKSFEKFVPKNPRAETSYSSTSSSGVDPYRQLQSEDKRFIDSITNMGFKRIVVSKAFQRIGRDEKQVLDFLCGMNRLKEKGFSETDAEEVLILLENDHKKAQSFLALSRRFREFGFDTCKVKEGLLQCDLDEERTLDWLTTH